MNYAAYEAITSYGGIRTEDKPKWHEKIRNRVSGMTGSRRADGLYQE
jgi:hypothetical protein